MHSLKLLLILFLIPTFCWSQGKIVKNKTPWERAIEVADRHFNEGDYKGAANAYRFALNLMYVEDALEVQKKLAKTQQIQALYKQVYANFEKTPNSALKYIADILRLNPADSQAKRLRRDIEFIAGVPTIPTPNPKTPEERWLERGKELERQKEYAKARDVYDQVLALYPNNIQAQSDKKRVTILINGPNVPPPSPVAIPCDEQKYTSLKKQMMVAYNNCELQKAKRLAKEILQLTCNNDLSVKRLMDNIAITQQQLRNIADWKSGGDNSRRDLIIPEYERVFRKSPNCVEWDYFYYVYYGAERMRANDPCNKNAVGRYLQARRISETLAIKENIDQKIASIDQCTDCNSKSILFVQITNEAQRLYKQCRYEEALKRYKEALPYNCSEKTQGIANVWENELLPQLERNQIQANRFVMLKSSADSLGALGECQGALKYYQAADSIQIDCIKLNKQDLSVKIEKMQCCVDLKKFKGLRDTVLQALRGDLILNTDPQLNTRAFCRNAINALNLANNNRCIDTLEVKRLFDISCKVCTIDYPTTFKCPQEPITLKDTTKYGGIELLAGGFYNNPVITSATRLTLPSWGYGGWIVGVNYVHSFQSFGEWKVGASFSNNHFEIKQPFAEKENFDFQMMRFIAEFDWKPRNLKDYYPFLTVGVIMNLPLKFTYRTGTKTLLDRTLLTNTAGLKIGGGYVLKRRYAISATYDFAGLFQADSAKPPILITDSGYNTLGISFRYRFLKDKAKTKE